MEIDWQAFGTFGIYSLAALLCFIGFFFCARNSFSGIHKCGFAEFDPKQIFFKLIHGGASTTYRVKKAP